MLKAISLTKQYGDSVAVSNVNLHVRPGEIYGFLGPNGAGKTTTIMMLLGMIPPTSGEVFLLGKRLGGDRFNTRRRIGVLAEFQFLYEEMTACEYLRFFADFYQVENRDRRIDAVLDRLGLSAAKHQLLKTYSKGMKQKLGLARAILHDPELLVLDEPVSSLDPHGVREVRDLLLEENRKGKTLFISSHILSEIERTCHRVGIIDKGVVVAEDTMDGIRHRVANEIVLEIDVEEVPAGLLQRLEALEWVTSAELFQRRFTVKTRADADYRGLVSRAITEGGAVIVGMRVKELSLEEAFITITEANVDQLSERGRAS